MLKLNSTTQKVQHKIAGLHRNNSFKDTMDERQNTGLARGLWFELLGGEITLYLS
jgi:hypothetical protein